MRVELVIPDDQKERLLWALEAHNGAFKEVLAYYDFVEDYDAENPVPLDGDKDVYVRVEGCMTVLESVLSQLRDRVAGHIPPSTV